MVIMGGGGGKEGLFVSRLNLPDPPIELFDNLVISPKKSPRPPHPRAKKTTGLLAKVFLNGKKTRENF